MDLEIIILSEVMQTQKDKCHMILFVCEIEKYDTNKLIQKTDPQTQKTNLGLLKGKGKGGIN